MTHSRAAALYLALRRDLSRADARRSSEAARIPIEGRTCTGKVKNGKTIMPCRSTHYHQSRQRGPVCASCGKGWPTRIVVEFVVGTGIKIPRERTMDLAADLGRLFTLLPLWERRVFSAWDLDCECGERVPHHARRWRKLEVAEHLAEHHPRAVEMTTPERVEAEYEKAYDRIEGWFASIEKVYAGRAV